MPRNAIQGGWLAALAVLAAALGCSSSARNTTACEVGTSAPCRDSDGCAGTRLCQPNGELGPCQCSPAAGGSGGGSGSAGSGGAGGSSGSGGTAGSGGADASAGSGGTSGTGGSGGSTSCPSGRGARMVVATSPAGSFCIDATETTNAEYAQFLANPDVAPQPAVCAWNQSFEPRFPTSRGPTLPVVGVDFCDARAYCEWAGKRLCGRIGGGATPFNSHADARESQWYAACSAGGTRTFPYGNSYDPLACNGADQNADVDALVPVASTRCEGGPPGVFDMSGNAWEWENSCNGETGVDDKCRLRSGEFTNPSGFLRCDYGEFYIERDFTSNSIGIRCCGP